MKRIRRRLAVWLLMFLSTGVTSVHAQREQAEPPELTAPQQQLNLESFEYIWNTVNEKYWDPSFGGLDWQAVHDELRPKIEQSTTMREARGIMRDMISRLKVSHFAVVPKEAYKLIDEPEDKSPRDGTVGIDARVVGDQPLVTCVEEGSPAAEAGVRPGWEVVRIGDKDVAEGIQELTQEFADNPMKRTILSATLRSRFRVPVGESVTAQFRDGQDQVVEKTMTAVTPSGRKSRFGHLPEFFVNIEVKKLEPNIGYVTFNAFMVPPFVMQKFNDAMLEFMDADGIIIDIRGNGGGMGEMAAGMIGWLIGDEDEVLGRLLIRDLDLKMIAKPRPKRYTGPVVLLIDELSVSAAEFMASGVKDTGCGYLIGTRTAGAVLGSRVERLPNGDGFQYAAVNFISAKTGKMLEGTGVPPDLEIVPSRATLLEGRDLVLEEAVKWIQNEGR